jgi:hypothetical protein
MSEQAETDSTIEWGVRHSQGIRTCRDERDAQESLEWMTVTFEKHFRNKVRPTIVTRTVTPWVDQINRPAEGGGDRG